MILPSPARRVTLMLLAAIAHAPPAQAALGIDGRALR